MNPKLLTAILLAGLIATQAGAETIKCPAGLAISQSLAAPPPQGWSVMGQPMLHQPQYVEFFVTNPRNMGSLVPTETHLTGSTGYAIWNFAASDSNDLWLGCHYNLSTLMLYQPLPPHLKTCRVTYAPGGIVSAINCH